MAVYRHRRVCSCCRYLVDIAEPLLTPDNREVSSIPLAVVEYTNHIACCIRAVHSEDMTAAFVQHESINY